MALKKTMDFSNVSEGFDLLPAGTYSVHIFNLEEKTSSNGNDMLKLTLKVSKGEYKGRQIFTNLTFVESAMFKIREFLIAVGAKIEKKSVNIDFSKTIGKEVKVIVYHRKNTQTDETYSDIKKFLPVSDTSASVTATAANAATAADEEEDELPFK